MNGLRTVLLVDDDPDSVVLTLRAFEKGDIRGSVQAVNDGADALDFLFGEGREGRGFPGAPALVLLDLKLPKVGGLEVLKRIRSERLTRHMPVVIFTASTLEIDLRQGYRLGANSYVRKPVNYDAFMEAVRQIGRYWLRLNEPPLREI